MLDILKRSYSYEELLVKDVMKELRILDNKNPFDYLVIQLRLDLANNAYKIYTYIFNKGKIYVDDEDKICNNTKDLNFKKYCYLLNGKPKSFVDLEKYEFLKLNLEAFKLKFEESLKAKKELYRIGNTDAE